MNGLKGLWSAMMVRTIEAVVSDEDGGGGGGGRWRGRTVVVDGG